MHIAQTCLGLRAGGRRLFEQAGVFESVGNLVGHGLEHRNVFKGKGRRIVRLYGHDAYGAALVSKRQKYFGPCFRKQVVARLGPVFAFVESNVRLAVGDAPADERGIRDIEFVSRVEHFPAGFTGTRPQKRVFFRLIDKKNGHV